MNPWSFGFIKNNFSGPQYLANTWDLPNLLKFSGLKSGNWLSPYVGKFLFSQLLKRIALS